MKRGRGYRVARFSVNRRMVAASATVGREHNNIHAFTEVDISALRRRMREHRACTGQSLSLTAYVVACLARAVAENRTADDTCRLIPFYLLRETYCLGGVMRQRHHIRYV